MQPEESPNYLALVSFGYRLVEIQSILSGQTNYPSYVGMKTLT